MSQFFYSRPEPLKDEKGKFILDEEVKKKTKTRTDSFDINRVIRSIEIEDDKLVVILDDIHDRKKQVPSTNPKTGQPTGNTRTVEETFQSEIYITVAEEIKEFRNIAAIKK